MSNNKRPYWVVVVVLAFACVTSHGGNPTHSNRIPHEGQDMETVLVQLLSPNEASRFQALDTAKKHSGMFAADEIDRALMHGREKNVSTLIFVFMETNNDILYRLSPPAKKELENSRGSFPNIAYYYARVRPSDGLTALFHLYATHDEAKMAICKAIGETGDLRGAAFLLRKTEQAQGAGSRIPMLAGLTGIRSTVDKSHIASLLTADLDREEIILVSKLNTDFSQKELISFYRGNHRERAYALEYIFRTPEANFEALRSIVVDMITQKQMDRARELMMSDRIRRSTDERVQEFRKLVMEQVDSQVHSGDDRSPGNPIEVGASGVLFPQD